MRRFLMLLTCLANVGLFSTAATAQTATVQSLTRETLVAQAKKEGKVVWYTTPGMSNMLRSSLDEWKRRYPEIAAELVEGTGPELAERVRTERRASRPVGDILNLGDLLSFGFANENGYQPLNLALLPNAEKISPILKKIADPQHRYVPLWVQSYGIVINTQIVPPADEPKKWADLLSPKFARKLSFHDFSREGGGLSWMMVAMPALGEKFFQDFMAQQPRVFGRPQEMFAAIARGERALGIPGSSGILDEYENAPIKVVYPQDGALFIVSNVGIVNGAPHPAAATLFLDHLLSAETQKQYSEKRRGPVRDDVPAKDLSLADAKLLGAGFQTPADLDKVKAALELGAKLVRQ